MPFPLIMRLEGKIRLELELIMDFETRHRLTVAVEGIRSTTKARGAAIVEWLLERAVDIDRREKKVRPAGYFKFNAHGHSYDGRAARSASTAPA